MAVIPKPSTPETLDPELLTELIPTFLSSYPSMMSRIKESVTSNNPQELREAVHSLKGAVCYFDPNQTVSVLAQQLEDCGKSGVLDGTDQIVERLQLALDELVRQLPTHSESNVGLTSSERPCAVTQRSYPGGPDSSVAPKPVTILVVDDGAVDRRLVATLLHRSSQCPYKVIEAKSGIEALAFLEGELPGLVLTDLIMPVMDGLQLVKEIKRRHLEIPVVLMTAYGSEDLAVAALQAGAASYLPKEQIEEGLERTIQVVLSASNAAVGPPELPGALLSCEWQLQLDGDYHQFLAFLGWLRETLTEFAAFESGTISRIYLATYEAIHNALIQGNLEITDDECRQYPGGRQVLIERRRAQYPYRDRRLQITIRLSQSELSLKIAHDGQGLNYAKHLTSPIATDRIEDRSFVLIRLLMDQVDFAPSGKSVTLIKRRDS